MGIGAGTAPNKRLAPTFASLTPENLLRFASQVASLETLDAIGYRLNKNRRNRSDMRYFTRQWQSGNMSDEEAEQIVESYRHRIEQIIAEFPPDLRRLAKDVSLHDGLFKAVTVSAGNATIEVQLRCGDLQTGYCDLEIIYRGARLVVPPLEELGDLLNGKELEIL